MKKYIISAPMGATFGVGTILKLTAKQAKVRAANLNPLKKPKGTFEVKAPVMFKLGEEIGLADNINKAILTSVIPEGELEAPVAAGGDDDTVEGSEGEPISVASKTPDPIVGDDDTIEGSENGSETDAPAS